MVFNNFGVLTSKWQPIWTGGRKIFILESFLTQIWKMFFSVDSVDTIFPDIRDQVFTNVRYVQNLEIQKIKIFF